MTSEAAKVGVKSGGLYRRKSAQNRAKRKKKTLRGCLLAACGSSARSLRLTWTKGCKKGWEQGVTKRRTSGAATDGRCATGTRA